jgi:8-oxo-dGTP pyrophosphatase MutT (NUDIX family)
MGEDIKISCGIYLINSDSKLLIGHPTKHKPNVWTIPKGRVDDGESDYFEVAKRELLEETNIDLNQFKIDKLVEFELVRYRETNKYLKGFFVKINQDFLGHNIRCDSMVYRNGNPSFPEFDDFKWVSIDEASRLIHGFQIGNLDRCRELMNINEHIINFQKFIYKQK